MLTIAKLPFGGDKEVVLIMDGRTSVDGFKREETGREPGEGPDSVKELEEDSSTDLER